MTDTFPGAADGEPDEAAYVVLGAPLDASTTFYPGTRFGPDRIRHHAQGFEDYDHRTDQLFSDLAVVDVGDLRPWQDVAGYLDFLTAELQEAAAGGAVPIVLGGEHTVSTAGVRATAPDHLVCLDAHLDLRPEFDGTAWSHATAVHKCLEVADRVTLLGARSGSEDEWDRARSATAVEVVPPAGVDDWLARSPADRVGETPYLSIDIDGIDPAAAPATGTREPFGLSARLARRIVHDVAPRAVGCDVVEVNDRDEGRTATLAAKLVREFVFTHADHHAP